MKNLITSVMVATVLSLTTYSAHSQQIPDQWSRTLQLVGYWEGPAELNLGGQVFNVTYYADFKTAVDGAALTMYEGFSDPNLGELKGANLIGLNATDGLIHWFSADNFGTAHEHIGSWSNNNHFYMEHQSLVGGQTFTEYISLKLQANNTRIKLQLIATLDNDTVQVLTGTFYLQNGNRIGDVTSDADAIEIYPNPNDGFVYFESEDAIKEISVINEMGQLIYIASPNETNYKLQLNENGVYLVNISSGNKMVTRKVVVVK